ncbi:MAG TPA: S41 family peptidase [Xanthobacteraceae bacterium]|nr:S41 family peptidase [Xanthobacteraceae bacterium]
MRRFSLIFLGALAGAAGAFVLSPGHLPQQARAETPSASQAATDTYRQLELFGLIFDQVREHYVDTPDSHKLVESAVSGMLSGLDPHSSYMDAKEFSEMQVENSGEFGGLGMEVTMEDGLVKVVSPIDDTPAAKAGILANDLILELDGTEVKGLTLQQAVEKMRGPINTQVHLKIQRKGADKPLDVTLTRETIRVRTVKSHKEGDDVGYMRLSQFNAQAGSELKKAISELQGSEPDKIKGYILDLRNNPGGLLDQAVEVSNAFLDRGEIVSLRGRDPDDAQRFDAKPGQGDLIKGKPLIVLVNGGSASASEIVAGALQDQKRATILGTRSFGKGSVQTIIPLGSGNGALRLTTARYYTPSGKSIQAKGISPDIEVVQDVPADVQAQFDMTSESKLRGHLAAQGQGNEQSGSQAYVPPDPKDDKALHAAIDILRGVNVSTAHPADGDTKPTKPN